MKICSENLAIMLVIHFYKHFSLPYREGSTLYLSSKGKEYFTIDGTLVMTGFGTLNVYESINIIILL